VEAGARAGHPVGVPAPVLTEVTFGLARAAARDARFGAQLSWLEGLVHGPEVRVLPFDRDAGLLAGRLRALGPHPGGTGRRDPRAKPERRVAWVLDLQIAATAWVAGCDLATENRSDFARIADLLVEIGLERLGIRDAPF
jgi:predicted nucleic acid-binding protein